MKNKVEDLRDHLFEMIERLKDDTEQDMEGLIKRARAVSDLSGRIIESAKVENDFLEITGAQHGSGFLPEAPRSPGGGRQLSSERAGDGERAGQPMSTGLVARIR